MHPAAQQAISTLLAEGKTPTVATIKTKLAEPLPMPTIIAALATYKSNPETIKNTAEQSQLSPAQPQSQLDRIEAKLDKLLALLEDK
ncbi:hypothetical protein [Pseudoalteromonas luteoviolacea]|uniref:KfrA N-terminal DNA-binding domain-containing protein n=1 Tax=Pseudoalteromonas luteoviolacea S4054 TaxID=1129367 RepID=A0A0F6A4F2_9GAMM|nr:hypothetical protein [Pseudoalteromonas luteoviolacea]AOT09485.1 hypothetical protein S4054249_17255 [Pseudoalteromonas luteoviolacea]AOT14397.1 hypothetical protein S40542_17225 [Pseudoalteromonas luteoviolacea]AOT19313.1 hypothetical protein S4054_17230 [Pseudoalteromonas luteoviolacea]KKE80943.1 hypothetical protein N479_24300 [Pseudoalteromonas luteoviolacea S4054]KZN65281.1 hypothetical protein N481_02480 [Pseudoalteromonas luteoviolacea S4047-1]